MYEAELRAVILRILARWGSLPESDVLRRLPPPLLAELREKTLERLREEGLLDMRTVGDEQVLRITARGREAVVEPEQGL